MTITLPNYHKLLFSFSSSLAQNLSEIIDRFFVCLLFVFRPLREKESLKCNKTAVLNIFTMYVSTPRFPIWTPKYNMKLLLLSRPPFYYTLAITNKCMTINHHYDYCLFNLAFLLSHSYCFQNIK